ncbi:hypothetical protein BVC80_1819g45 [Macleaya cordata]|uniref:Uncharacterized protein n=1 Tax=Macleaya cordata TaxID=56857 RepID=A0A200QW75_MACCD|nr:hypothetical protein BVC80_1819g45 [Macleaya cordata]
MAFLSSTRANYKTTNSDPMEARNTTESDPSKDQLLEALRHSQTRAREAEKSVKQAYSEKEYIIELIFRQASDLFAYKQWIQLLQLETICHQFKHKDQLISALFPVVLPWMPNKSKQVKKGKHKTSMGKKGQSIYDIMKNVVAFAVGLGLVGAGLLLGWTIGWLLPRF